MRSRMTLSNSRAAGFCLSLLLILATLLAFAPVCTAEFIALDDPDYASRNPYVRGGLTWDNAVWAFRDSGKLYRLWLPLAVLSLQLDATLYGPDAAWGFHFTNLFWHCATVVLLFWVLRGMTGALGLAAVVAALFALHP